MSDATTIGTPKVGDTPRYVEHLRAPWWAWLVLLSLSMCISIAVGYPIGLLWGLITFLIFGGLSTWFLLRTNVAITVTESELRVGRAHIGWEYTGIVATLDAESASLARGVGADPRAFAVNRTLSAKEAVSLEVLDTDDPHPYWLVSTTRPAELGRAIRLAQQAFELQ